MSEDDGPRPAGSAPCPQCGQPVSPGIVFCSQCGARLAAPPSPRRAMSQGLRGMLGGILLSGLAGFVFFASCLGGMATPGIIAAGVLGLAGILAILYGFVVALRDLRES